MPRVEVAAADDPRLDDFARRTDVALRGDRGAEHGLYLVESLLLFERALGVGHVPRAVLTTPAWADRALGALAGAADRVPVYVGADELLAQVTGYALHRGVVASFERPPLPDPAALLAAARRVVVLEDVADPTNVGAIFRSVAGIGADAVLVTPRCSDPFYRRAIRVSMGTVLQVPWSRAPGWTELAPLLRDAGFAIAALALADDAVPLREYAAHPPDRLALVLGAEGPGLSREALAAADARVMIPMRHGIDSLNVAAAAAVAMFAVAE